MDKDYLEYLKSLGISVARGVPQLATGFVDLASLPFTLSGLIKPEQAVGSTDWMTAKGYLPPKQEGLLNETTELLSGVVNPAAAIKTGLLGIGATAFHGTPHKIKGAFDISKVGTGEGAQSYGHGMYFAENPNVAKEYQKMLAGPEQTAADYLKMYKTPENAISVLKDSITPNLTPEAKKFAQDAIDVLKSGKELKGNLYKVDIPDAAIPKMLNWDEPLNKQSQAVKDALDKLGIRIDEKANKAFLDDLEATLKGGESQGVKYVSNPTGAELYQKLVARFGSPEIASSELNKLGITGIRYLDEGSRATGQGTSNFVTFDPSIVKILEENGVNVDQLLKSGLLGN